MKQILILAAIVFLAAILRLVAISAVPPALNWDEVSHGYNAYSILKTGADEWGVRFPLTAFRAFGDFKLPVYIYTLIPFVAAFGLTEFAVRTPSAAAGVLTVLFTFLLVQRLFKNPQLSAASSLLLALSPWHTMLSRAAFEANLALLLVVAAAYFFLVSLEKPQFLSLSAFLFGLSLFTYTSARIFVPLLILAAVFIFKKEFFKIKKNLILPVAIFLFFFIPTLLSAVSPGGQARFYWTTILDAGAINQIEEARVTSKLPEALNVLINNRPVYFITHFIPNWASHFSPGFLFWQGGSNLQYSIGDRGVLYPVEAILITFGLWYLVTGRTKVSALLFAWLLLAPIATAATRESPNVLRSILILPTWQIMAALGLIEIKRIVGKLDVKLGQAFLFFALAAVVFSASFFLRDYFGQYRVNYSFAWQYGYKQVAQFLKDNRHRYDRIVITKKYGEPHIFLLFYNQVDPSQFQNDPQLLRCFRSNWYWVDRFSGYEFVNDWEVGKLKKDQVLPAACSVPNGTKKLQVDKMLLVTSPGNYSAGGRLISTINFLNGEPAFDLVEF